MPDEERNVVQDTLASKLASITGLTPKQPAVTNSSLKVDWSLLFFTEIYFCMKITYHSWIGFCFM